MQGTHKKSVKASTACKGEGRSQGADHGGTFRFFSFGVMERHCSVWGKGMGSEQGLK